MADDAEGTFIVCGPVSELGMQIPGMLRERCASCDAEVALSVEGQQQRAELVGAGEPCVLWCFRCAVAQAGDVTGELVPGAREAAERVTGQDAGAAARMAEQAPLRELLVDG